MSRDREGGLQRVWRVEKIKPPLLPEAENAVKMDIHAWVNQNLSILKPGRTKGMDGESYQLLQVKDK